MTTPITLEQGDAFEKRNAEWIRTTLPDYERIWAAFIGHDGHGNPLPMAGLDDQQDQARKRFCQAHYSMVRKLKLLDDLVERMPSELKGVTSFEEFEAEEERLFRFGAYMGHIHDMFEAMDTELRFPGSLYQELRSFYAQRNHIIHSPQIPHMLVDGLFCIPRISVGKSEPGRWHRLAIWDDIPEMEFIPLAQFVQETALNLKAAVQKLHAKVFAAASLRFDCKKIQLPISKTETPPGRQPNPLRRQNLETSLSVPAVSGQRFINYPRGY